VKTEVLNTKSRKDRYCKQRLTFTQLPGQFIIGNTGIRVPDGWKTEKIGGWHLGRHSTLPRIWLLGDDSAIVGWLLGYPIDGNGSLLSDGDERHIPGLSNGKESRGEDFIYGFGGRFLAALVGVGHPRIYLDPGGSLAAVYCPHQGVIASTLNLIPYDDQTRHRIDLARELGIPDTNAMYPLELTPRHNVVRLLPNHYLDLSNWQSIRHWPKKPMHHEGSVEEAIATVAEITKRNIAAVVSKTPTYLRLTSGQDSRMMLACAKDMADRLELFTVPIPDDSAAIDVDIARKIARRFRLRHFVPEFQEPKPEDLSEFMARIAYCTGELRGWRASTMFKQANPAYAQLDGGVGDLVRISEELRPGETISSKITAERLLSSCLAPCSGLTRSVYNRWLETIPAVNAFQVLDLYYIEQRVGCWGGNLHYAESPDPGFVIYPMCHRKIIEKMATLPVEYRLSGALMRDVINREWPDLLAWPFNRPDGWKKVVLAASRTRNSLEFQSSRVGRALQNPGRAFTRVAESIHLTVF
jgi:hypothetical protein